MDHNLNVHHPYFFFSFFFCWEWLPMLCVLSLSLFTICGLSVPSCLCVCLYQRWLSCLLEEDHRAFSQRRIREMPANWDLRLSRLYNKSVFICNSYVFDKNHAPLRCNKQKFSHQDFFFFHLVHKEKLLRLLEGGKQEIIIKTLISLKVFKMLSFCWCRWNF